MSASTPCSAQSGPLKSARFRPHSCPIRRCRRGGRDAFDNHDAHAFGRPAHAREIGWLPPPVAEVLDDSGGRISAPVLPSEADIIASGRDRGPHRLLGCAVPPAAQAVGSSATSTTTPSPPSAPTGTPSDIPTRRCPVRTSAPTCRSRRAALFVTVQTAASAGVMSGERRATSDPSVERRLTRLHNRLVVGRRGAGVAEFCWETYSRFA